ncbi:hypothetical protein [Streptacidiphilus sp. EB103A]|uniref:hypothetical protein n=1 Tax=Streptacidiphilus sp. EB103A TaxID=3156275 RepID=UPI0035173A32
MPPHREEPRPLPLPPFTPADFEDPCEDCGALAGTYCSPDCDSGYSAEDARAQALRRDQNGR